MNDRWAKLPPHAAGMRIGLFGGSFNPVHEGHRLVAVRSLLRLRLDRVWLLVSPGNPLKDHSDLAPLPDRVAAVRRLVDHPRIEVTGFEAAHSFRYTFDTLTYLRQTAPQVRFVWIMGGDSLSSFHHWERWRDIARLVPIAVYVRPGSRFSAPRSPAATMFETFRIPERQAGTLADRKPPAWVYLTGTMSSQSSSAIRARALEDAAAQPPLRQED